MYSGSTPGYDITSQIGSIVKRTILHIERDMGRREHDDNASQGQPRQQHESFGPVKREGTETNDGMPQGSSVGPYYNPNGNGAETNGQPAPYPPIPYQEQHPITNANGTSIAYDPSHAGSSSSSGMSSGYLYPAPSTDMAGVSGGSASMQSPSNLVSQAQQHATNFMNGANPWHDWAASMTENEDRYSANALLDLGAAHQRKMTLGPGIVGEASTADLAVSGPVAHSAQWPLLLFHDPSSGPVNGSG